MRAQKRKRLEKAGWKLGSAKEFLGLTAEEEAVVDLKLVLARAVREERSKRKLISIDLLVRALLRMGASRRDVGRWLARPARRAA